MSTRVANEIAHGQYLAQNDPERVWGWGTPAGRARAWRRADLVAAGAHLGPGTRALEVGCGTGMFTEMFFRSGSSIVAVDLSGELLAKARARGLPGSRVRFVEARFEDCDAEGPFDAVIGSSILHHLDLGEAFPAIHRLLKPGGVMSFAEPNMLNPQVFAERKFRRFFPSVSPDETAFVRWRLAETLRRVGFESVEIVPFDWLHPSIPRPLIGMTLAMGRFLERTPVLREFSGSLYIRAARPQE